MPLNRWKATRPKHWSKRRNSLPRARSALAVLIPFVLLLSGCAEEPAGDDSEQEVLQEEADRQSESSDDRIVEIDDERSVERRIKDATVAAKIRTALVETKELRRFDFDPVVVNGRVMLRGEVSTQDERRRAAEIAEAVDGVSGVINEVAATEEPTPDAPDDAARDSMIAAMERAQSRDTAAAGATSSKDDSKADDPAPAAENSAVYHTVSSGESLWIIANRNDVSIAQIRQLNNLRSDKLKPGQRLRVK